MAVASDDRVSPASHLRAVPQTEGGTLQHLKESLAEACDEHYAGGCRAPLRFAVELQFGVNALFGYCDVCKAFLMIA